MKLDLLPTDSELLRAAAADLGLREIPGVRHAPKIQRWLAQMGAWWTDDETPWCGVAMDGWARSCDLKPPSAAFRARSWADWGTPLPYPARGAVVVFNRPGGAHVGIVVGRDQLGRLLVLGGNQGNAVSVAPFDTDRVVAYRLPPGQKAPNPGPRLPTIASSAPASTNEA